MILQMAIKYSRSYNETNIFGLGNAFYNYLIGNKIFEKEFDKIVIEEKECLCLLKDDETLLENRVPDVGVCRIRLVKSHDFPEKYATSKSTAEFLKNINTIFHEGQVEKIVIEKQDGAEII